MDPHESLQEAGAGVKQDSLHPAGRERIAAGNVDGEGFMPAVHQLRAVPALMDLVGHGFPNGCPFGPRGGQDVLDLQIPDRFENCVTAIQMIFQVSASLAALMVRPSLTLGRDHRTTDSHKQSDLRWPRRRPLSQREYQA